MNRKERRFAAKSEAAGPASALALARALHRLGEAARRQGRPEEAIAHLTQATAAAPDVAAIHDGLAEAYRAIARPAEAERHYRRVAELRPGAVTLLHLGNALLELHRPAEARAAYESALRFDARLPEALHGLGNALAALGRPEAGDAFDRAAALRPGFAPAHEGLIDACIAADAWGAALEAASRALLHADTPRLRALFIDCARRVTLANEVPGLHQAMHRALSEGWTRPQDLVAAACALVALRQPLDLRDPLLRCVMRLAPVCHRGIERALTEQRRAVLEAAASGCALPADTMHTACGLARQCFVNEYAWRCLPEEWDRVGLLRRAVQADLDRGVHASESSLAVLAMYLPLDSLAGAERLSGERPAEIAALIAQQVGEPAEERRLRDTILRATPIEDGVSRAVQQQYEENPYPRWVAAARATQPVWLGEWLAARFPGAPAEPRAGKVLDVLIAGCGTGQQALETVQGLRDVAVLAIDLSLASLAYAARVTASLGASNIEYRQADLLRSGQLGRTFDMIGAGGVLHHLADPWAGWRTLLGLLRPGGVMNVLLYTERGRADVRCARDWIAAQGYPATPQGIRDCRQHLMDLPDGWALRLSESPDFCSTSGCRDLLFHVREAAVTLPEVSGFLSAEGIDLLGVEVSGPTGRAFEAWSGGDEEALRDLARWDRFEAEHPRCFAGMLNLWLRKPSGEAAPLGAEPR